jgi:hypothetical protein
MQQAAGDAWRAPLAGVGVTSLSDLNLGDDDGACGDRL